MTKIKISKAELFVNADCLGLCKFDVDRLQKTKVITGYDFHTNSKILCGHHEICIYENAGHGFANSGDGYVKAAAELAWKRTVFFNNYL